MNSTTPDSAQHLSMHAQATLRQIYDPQNRTAFIARMSAIEPFAAERKWRLAHRTFSLDQLRCARHGRLKDSDYHCDWPSPWFDHLDFFRGPVAPWRPIAVVTHTYARPDDAVAAIEALGFATERIAVSWYSPDTHAILVTRAPRLAEAAGGRK